MDLESLCREIDDSRNKYIYRLEKHGRKTVTKIIGADPEKLKELKKPLSCNGFYRDKCIYLQGDQIQKLFKLFL